MFKGLIVLLLIAGCNKKPDQPKVVNIPIEEPEVSVVAGNCYRYPNVEQKDVHVKVIRTYLKGGMLGEFIINKKIFTDAYDISGARHLKEIDCQMFEDLKTLSKPQS